MSPDFLTTDILQSVFHMKYNGSTGTTFLIEKDSTNYFVTAKHIIKDSKYGDKLTIEIYQDSLWKTLTGEVYFDKLNDIDIALIKPENFGYVKSGITFKQTESIIGDEGFFLGFPYGLKTNFDNNVGFPLPLIKKALFSGTIIKNGIQTLFLDGHNNPGFSGGPVLFKDRRRNGDNKYHLIGVISAYFNQQNELITPFGKLKYNENSGIIIAFEQKHILEVIQKIKTP